MANFDASLGNNETEITYFDNGTHFVCMWSKIYLQDQPEAGPFTFQAILQNTGTSSCQRDEFHNLSSLFHREHHFQLLANSSG